MTKSAGAGKSRAAARPAPREGPRLVPQAELRLILSTVPTTPPDLARRLARKLVEDRLAACVNVLPAVVSVYLWKGAIQEDREALLIVKTTSRRCRACAQALKELHPYDVPEIVVIGPEAVSEPYWRWVVESVGAG
ncbi:MAG: divalent-cation tolerance protein CutA [Planctomycetota bacterium]